MKWRNDFVSTRNFSISKVTNDWILVLDADEYVSEFLQERIGAFINDRINEKIVGKIHERIISKDGTVYNIVHVYYLLFT